MHGGALRAAKGQGTMARGALVRCGPRADHSPHSSAGNAAELRRL
ncbi:hypothetical protein PXO_03043 [Xanthomonas oryzae pv. oryzae PXO99A]|uniref:Uncharacterized protein n=1 Tax=Xanthomonas oryzae pv. oryzae (strain PXO99A) TaxID=360094 RepID=A0A0K0GQH7_XANOP|nr:hypothetical protein PXO_03043 [Xanthomonas oryzae pv. oryzae PXO99A]